MDKTPPRTLPGLRSPDPFRVLAARLAGLPAESRQAGIEAALRDAHRAGISQGSPAVPAAESDLLADLRAAAPSGDGLALVQPLGPCPGMPWQAEVDGRAALDSSGFAALFPDAAVQGLVSRGALAPGRDGRLVPGPGFAAWGGPAGP